MAPDPTGGIGVLAICGALALIYFVFVWKRS
jgi:hypothetical protein